jgi:8-oxo-dGTP pyrophosphatase MutT (NUDIX family)
MKKKVQIVILSQNSDKNKLEVLLFKTTKDRGSFWQNVTGSVDNDEGFREASYRELVEETGIPENLAREHIYDIETEFFFFNRKDKRVQEKVFYYYGPKWDVIISPEHTNFKWKKVSSIEWNQYKYPSNYHALQKSLEKLQESLN